MKFVKCSPQGMAWWFIGLLKQEGLPVENEQWQHVIGRLAGKTYGAGGFMAYDPNSQMAQIFASHGPQMPVQPNANPTAASIPQQPAPLPAQPAAVPVGPVAQHQPNTGLTAREPAVVPTAAPVFDAAAASAGKAPAQQSDVQGTADNPGSLTADPQVPAPTVQF